MFNLMRLWVKREIVRVIIAPPDGARPVGDSHLADWMQRADEIRAQGSGTDFGAASIRAQMSRPFAPPRPKRPPQLVE